MSWSTCLCFNLYWWQYIMLYVFVLCTLYIELAYICYSSLFSIFLYSRALVCYFYLLKCLAGFYGWCDFLVTPIVISLDGVTSVTPTVISMDGVTSWLLPCSSFNLIYLSIYGHSRCPILVRCILLAILYLPIFIFL